MVRLISYTQSKTMYRLFLLSLISFAIQITSSAQSIRKQLPATRTTAVIKIDGMIDEAAWKEAKMVSGFTEQRPNPGIPENYDTRTEFYMLYDNTAVYVAGFMYERTADSISKELVGRDRIGVNDYAGVMLDTYNDRINATGFYVTPLGEQYDVKYSPTNEDGSWSAVWESETKIHSNGWSFEMRIPYSALRFVSSDNQTWGLNLVRGRSKLAQQFFWSPVDPKVGGFVNQGGEWAGISKIDAPVRLSFSPYLSAYVNHYRPDKKNWRTSINGGMDVKWGISESFTLDMTLIPDFGQVQSDHQILNLSSFEVRYQENRPFFTEGTELFNKGGLFYSRRIGSTPIDYGYPDRFVRMHGGTILSNPQESKLLNATKISGRTKSGLGIGVFNAVTKSMYAKVEDSSKVTHELQTSPLTNYSIVVLDQNLKNNSSVSFVNTNVLREGSAYDANVSAAMFRLNNKKNSYRVSGQLTMSHVTRNTATSNSLTGFSEELSLGKTGGRWNFEISQEMADDKYDINDMGFLNNNNFFGGYFWTGYRWIKPKNWYNRIQINFNAGYNMLNSKFVNQVKDTKFKSFNVNVNGNAQLKSLWWVGGFIGYVPQGNDFYEPRHTGWSFQTTERVQFSGWFESNSSKKYFISVNYFVGLRDQFQSRNHEFNFEHRYRFNDKFALEHDIYYNPFSNDAGFYKKITESDVLKDILFSRRDRKTVENVIEAKYSFSNKSGFTISARHYWSKVTQKELYDLQRDGSLISTKHTTVPLEHRNVNLFNVDAQYTLQFAPGSFINIVWKDQSQLFDREVDLAYGKNFNRILSTDQNNNLSIKVIYYLDYLSLKRKK